MTESIKLIMVTTPGHAVGESLAHGLIEAKLAGCVNLIPGLTSIYRWQADIHSEEEVLMVIKTTADNVTLVEQWIHRHHPYEIPAFVVLSPEHVAPLYLNWLQGITHV